MTNKVVSIFAIVLMTIASINAQEEQEVVIMGTMHTVSKIVSKAYKPMLNKAIKYAPEAIYVERQPSWDTISIKNYFPKFYANADSLSRAMVFDQGHVQALLNKATSQLSKKEANELRLYYYSKLDFANMEFYRRVARYGAASPKKPTRNENGDITYPLALAMGIKNIKSMDNQTYNREYYLTWKGCDTISRADGQIKLLEKALKKHSIRNITGVLTFQGLGKITNKPKNTALSHSMNSMEYRETNAAVCDEANYYWGYRNEQMVKNTAEQMLASGDKRSIIVVGAGHVHGMMEVFARDYPQIKVIRFNDIPNNKGKSNLAEQVSKGLMASWK